MKTPSDSKLTKDTPFQGRACSGFLMISVSVLLLAAGIALIILSEVNKAELGNSIYNTLCIFAVLLLIIAPVLLIGLMILEPNQARAMVFFGTSSGSIPSTPRRKSRSAPATSTWTPSRSMTATAIPSS